MNTAWTLLVLAGLFEVVWAVGLKYTEGFTRLSPSVITLAAMIVSFYLLARALRTIPVGTATPCGRGLGQSEPALVGLWLLDEPRTAARLLSIALIVLGIVGLKLATPA